MSETETQTQIVDAFRSWGQNRGAPVELESDESDPEVLLSFPIPMVNAVFDGLVCLSGDMCTIEVPSVAYMRDLDEVEVNRRLLALNFSRTGIRVGVDSDEGEIRVFTSWPAAALDAATIDLMVKHLLAGLHTTLDTLGMPSSFA